MKSLSDLANDSEDYSGEPAQVMQMQAMLQCIH